MQQMYQSYFKVMQTSRFLLMVCFLFTLRIVADAQDTLLSQQLKQYVSFLASDSLKGRFAGTREGDIAANFIAKEMQRIGLRPLAGFDGYFTPFSNRNDIFYRFDKLKNVVGVIAGSFLKSEVV